MGAELLHTDKTKTIVAFRKFVNAPKISVAALKRKRFSDTCHVSLMNNKIHVATREVFTGRLVRYEITVTCEQCYSHSRPRSNQYRQLCLIRLR